MRRTAWTLGTLMGASLVINVALLARISREHAGTPSSARRELPSATSGDNPLLLRQQLQAKEELLEKLRARIDGLEMEKSALAGQTPVHGVDAPSAFRDKIRHLKKISEEAKDSAEAQLELDALETEFQRLLLRRSKDAHSYVESLKIFYRESLAGTGQPLSPEQESSLASILGELEQGLGQIKVDSTGERLIREFELEGGLWAKINGLLSPDQQDSVAEGPLAPILSTDSYLTSYYRLQGSAEVVANSWHNDYGLDDSQFPLLQTVAQSYVSAMARLDNQSSYAGASPTQRRSPDAYQYRIRALREQMAALRTLEPALTPEQRARVRNGEMREMFFLNDR